MEPGFANRLNFYPRSPCGERPMGVTVLGIQHNFYPRSPCGERQPGPGLWVIRMLISIHALLAESDGDTTYIIGALSTFLSTLSLRRATLPAGILRSGSEYFYPRSPCGERHSDAFAAVSTLLISIHALLAESDVHIVKIGIGCLVFLSTLSLRRATFCLLVY